MTQPTWQTDHFEEAAGLQTVSVHFDNLTANQIVPFVKMPAAGRLVAARVASHKTVINSGATNWAVGIRNMGTASGVALAGTVLIAAANPPSGSAGLPAATQLGAGAVTTLVIDTAMQSFAAGEWLGIDYVQAGSPAPDFTVSIDYRLDNF